MNLARSCGEDNNEQCSTAQSSTDFGGLPQRANDGITADMSSWTHTRCDENPWWRVDFGSTKQILGGIIWSRAEGFEARLDGFEIWIGDSPTYDGQGNTNCFTATTTEHDTSPYTHSFPCTGLGRYFFVHLPRSECLHMREVEVLGITLKSGGPGSGEYVVNDFQHGHEIRTISSLSL